jgi:hypothetical protein
MSAAFDLSRSPAQESQQIFRKTSWWKIAFSILIIKHRRPIIIDGTETVSPSKHRMARSLVACRIDYGAVGGGWKWHVVFRAGPSSQRRQPQLQQNNARRRGCFCWSSEICLHLALPLVFPTQTNATTTGYHSTQCRRKA